MQPQTLIKSYTIGNYTGGEEVSDFSTISVTCYHYIVQVKVKISLLFQKIHQMSHKGLCCERS